MALKPVVPSPRPSITPTLEAGSMPSLEAHPRLSQQGSEEGVASSQGMRLQEQALSRQRFNSPEHPNKHRQHSIPTTASTPSVPLSSQQYHAQASTTPWQAQLPRPMPLQVMSLRRACRSNMAVRHLAMRLGTFKRASLPFLLAVCKDASQ